eukprot:jgi/Mesvir1/9945/Mv03566-RA.1
MCAPHSTLKAYKVIIKQALEAEELFEGGVPAVKATHAGGRAQGGSKTSEADRSQGGRGGNHNKRKGNHSPDPDGRSHSKSVYRRGEPSVAAVSPAAAAPTPPAASAPGVALPVPPRESFAAAISPTVAASGPSQAPSQPLRGFFGDTSGLPRLWEWGPPSEDSSAGLES